MRSKSRTRRKQLGCKMKMKKKNAKKQKLPTPNTGTLAVTVNKFALLAEDSMELDSNRQGNQQTRLRLLMLFCLKPKRSW